MWMGQNQNKKINFQGENWKKINYFKIDFFLTSAQKNTLKFAPVQQKVFWAWMWRIKRSKNSFLWPTKHEQLEQLHFCLCKKRPRKKKKQFGCGIHFCWFALQNFFTRWGRCRPKIAHPKSNLAVAKERSAKVGHPQSILQLFSSCFWYKQATTTSKTRPLHLKRWSS